MTNSAIYPVSYKEATNETLYRKGRVSVQKRAKEIDFSNKIPELSGFWGNEVKKILDGLLLAKYVEYEIPAGYTLKVAQQRIGNVSRLHGIHLKSGSSSEGKLYYRRINT